MVAESVERLAWVGNQENIVWVKLYLKSPLDLRRHEYNPTFPVSCRCQLGLRFFPWNVYFLLVECVVLILCLCVCGGFVGGCYVDVQEIDLVLCLCLCVCTLFPGFWEFSLQRSTEAGFTLCQRSFPGIKTLYLWNVPTTKSCFVWLPKKLISVLQLGGQKNNTLGYMSVIHVVIVVINEGCKLHEMCVCHHGNQSSHFVSPQCPAGLCSAVQCSVCEDCTTVQQTLASYCLCARWH